MHDNPYWAESAEEIAQGPRRTLRESVLELLLDVVLATIISAGITLVLILTLLVGGLALMYFTGID